MMNEWIVSSSILITAVLLGRWLLRGKISLRLQYALWLIVLVRLLVPMQLFASDFGAGRIAEQVDVAEPVRQMYASAQEDRYEQAYEAAYWQVLAEYEAREQSFAPADVEQEAAAQARERLEGDLNQVLCSIWLGGMAVMAMVILGCNANFLRRLRRSRKPVEDVDCLLPVYVTAAVPTPCLFGFFRPVVCLTPEAAADTRIRGHVLAHELTHYRHLDHIWSVLRSVCLVLHWYNPLVWLAAKISRMDAELACDEGALLRIGESQRSDYGRTLIGLSCTEKVATNFVAATTMTGSARSLATRLKLLMRRPRNTLLALICVVLIGTIVVGCAFSGAPETTQPTQTTVPNETTEPTGHPPVQDMSDHSEQIPIPGDPEAEIRTLFSADGDPENRGALTRLYSMPEEFSCREEDLFVPEITALEQVTEQEWMMYYKRPDSEILYVADLFYEEDCMIYSNKQVLSMADYGNLDPRSLTEEELARVKTAFTALTPEGEVNPAACFLNSTYGDVTDMSRRDFLAYFPGSTDGTREEFELLKEKYPEFFEGWTWENMPIPIHSYETEALNAVLQRYADMRWEDLAWDEELHYLEKTGCFYNYTSDFGLMGFPCTGGFVYDGGAVLYSNWSALFLTERDGAYFIQAHLPVMVIRKVQ